jgi:hypothetical protein
MPLRRTLTLKREVLQELSPADLNGVVGAAITTGNTGISCLDYVSCWVWQCLPETFICPE